MENYKSIKIDNQIVEYYTSENSRFVFAYCSDESISLDRLKLELEKDNPNIKLKYYDDFIDDEIAQEKNDNKTKENRYRFAFIKL